MKRYTYTLIVLCMVSSSLIFAQTNRTIGLRENTPQVFALTNADIYSSPSKLISNATMVIRNGVIEAIGKRVNIPADATIIDMEDKTIYPGFIDIFTHYGMPDSVNTDDSPHWNPQVRPNFNGSDHFTPNSQEADILRSQGFVLVQSVPKHGLFRGYGALVTLANGDAKKQIVKTNSTQVLSFQRAREFGRGYPTSVMGSIALLRQTFYDAQWYTQAHEAYKLNSTLERPETNIALSNLAHAKAMKLPFIIDVDNEAWHLRASQLASEFDINLWIKGNGFEYRRIDAITETGHPLILPINFPDAPDVSTPEKSMEVSLEDLRHWYLAPENPSKISQTNMTFAITANGSGNKFLKNLQKAVQRGLNQQKALEALTTRPANLLGVDKHYGTLEKGKIASFVITSNNIFDENARVLEVWVDGEKHNIKPKQNEHIGRWLVSSEQHLNNVILSIKGSQPRLKGIAEVDSKKVRLTSVDINEQRINLKISGDSIGFSGIYRLSAHVGKNEMLGAGETATGEFFIWTAKRIEQTPKESSKKNEELPQLNLSTRYPSMEFGLTNAPKQHKYIIIRNATIWTQGPDKTLKDADMLIENGKIAKIGKNLTAPRGAHEINIQGKHLTPGLVDPHLHSSIAGGVNEFGDAITSEVRILDVLESDNIWIYRLLAGGLTSAKLFHGSANPIGGQDAAIKMRWGKLPHELVIEDAKPGLKFALGENVKRTQGRYPSSRQGTEQIIKDAFQAALEYEKSINQRKDKTDRLPVRKNLQLETILEVLKGKRMAHVHAYRQDEILMTMRLAQEYGFTIGSFEHTLEGYKIADELREHGAAAVVWSDWSSFKVESYDGILHNAKLLTDAGVLTSLHSDNTQLSTRMNWEAAKTMRTGINEVDAMNLITLNPAKIMGVDHRVGSLEPGKDADFVIWNGHPLSSFSTPDRTFVDGIEYFYRQKDAELRKEVKRERAMIIERILQEKQPKSSKNQKK